MVDPSRRRAARIAAAAVLVAAVAGGTLAYRLTEHRAPMLAAAAVIRTAGPSPAVSSAPATRTAFGSLTLANSFTGSPECRGSGGYFDIKAGAPVSLRNAAGAPIARTTLGAGRPAGGGCVFEFTVAGIPAGQCTCELGIGGHHGPPLTDSDLARGAPINMALG